MMAQRRIGSTSAPKERSPVRKRAYLKQALWTGGVREDSGGREGGESSAGRRVPCAAADCESAASGQAQG